MEIHFPHLTNEIRNTPKQPRLIIPRRLLKIAATLILCSAALMLEACNVGSGGY